MPSNLPAEWLCRRTPKDKARYAESPKLPGPWSLRGGLRILSHPRAIAKSPSLILGASTFFFCNPFFSLSSKMQAHIFLPFLYQNLISGKKLIMSVYKSTGICTPLSLSRQEFSLFTYHQEGGGSVLEGRDLLVALGSPKGHLCPSLYLACQKHECISEAPWE